MFIRLFVGFYRIEVLMVLGTVSKALLLKTKGRFRRYNFCLRLSHAISRARAARDMQKIAHNSRHSTLPITTLVVGF